ASVERGSVPTSGSPSTSTDDTPGDTPDDADGDQDAEPTESVDEVEDPADADTVADTDTDNTVPAGAEIDPQTSDDTPQDDAPQDDDPADADRDRTVTRSGDEAPEHTEAPESDSVDAGDDIAVGDQEGERGSGTSAPSDDPAALTMSLRSTAADASGPKTTATPSAGLSGIVSKFLGLLGIGPSATNGNLPLPAFEFVTAVFGAIRREMDRFLANHGPTAALTSTSQPVPSVITGTVTASDPEGDKLVYSVVQAPARGTVTVDSSGTFTYTVNPASVAGNDSFVIQVRDAGFHLISVSPTKTQVPV
ncbi:chitinase, partial [Mycobacterium sp. ITM-2017-0098]